MSVPLDPERVIDALSISSRLRGILGVVAMGIEPQLDEILAEDPDLAPEIEAMRTHLVACIEAGERLVKFLHARSGLPE